MSDSLSRQIARYVASLTYDDIPSFVVDRVKALALHNLVMSFEGLSAPSGKAAIELSKAEEPRFDGATILGDGARVSRMGAVFANSQLMHVGIHGDSYRMLSHPGGHVVSSALVSGELERADGAAFLTGLVAGYEAHVRIAGPFVPSTQARGFRASPAYGIFGAAVATGKLLGLTEDQLVSAIALAATFAGGTVEGARVGGQETQYHDANATRNGVMAALIAKRDVRGSETALEGDAGFYYAFTGNNRGDLTYTFSGPDTVDIAQCTEGLGTRYDLLEVIPKIYPGKGPDNPVIELMVELKKKYFVNPQNVERITVEVNWLETFYPSPAFPSLSGSQPQGDGTAYQTAYTCVHGNYPRVRLKRTPGSSNPEDARINKLMERVTVEPRKDRGTYSPRITIAMKNGDCYESEYTGDELKYDLVKEAERIREVYPFLPVPANQLDELASCIVGLQAEVNLDTLIRLCVIV